MIILDVLEKYEGTRSLSHNGSFFIFIKKGNRLYPIDIHDDLAPLIPPGTIFSISVTQNLESHQKSLPEESTPAPHQGSHQDAGEGSTNS